MPQKLSDRVNQAAENALKNEHVVGPLELLIYVGFLAPSHVQLWKNGHERYPQLEPSIQCGEKKLKQVYRAFFQWVEGKNLEPVEIPYLKNSRRGAKPLQVSIEGDEETERFFRTRFRPVGLTPAKQKQLDKKLNKVPDLVVFQLTGKSATCSECETEISKGGLLFRENDQPLCLTCADLDHLEFLPSGDAAMTRRSKKLSPLATIVVRFNRSRKRYERQGILVTSQAIDEAEAQCQADAGQREKRREIDAIRRSQQDVTLTNEMAQIIQALFPNCPTQEAQEIASHTAQRGSGRVGRSAAGRELEEKAIELAVAAWVRHQHTDYDQMLMNGVERQEARESIRAAQSRVLSQWRG